MSIEFAEKVCTFIVDDDTGNGKISGPELVEAINADSGVTCVALGITTNQDEETEKHAARIDFENDIPEGEKALVSAVVSGHDGVDIKSRLLGNEYYEVPVHDTKWTRYVRRTTFLRKFQNPPEILVSDVHYDGTSELKVVKVSTTYFDCAIQARGRRKNSRAGLPTVSFEWEARL